MSSMSVLFAIVAVLVLQVGLSVYGFLKSTKATGGKLQLANI